MNYLSCPDSECLRRFTTPALRRVVRIGFYFRSSDGQWIPKFRCRRCRRIFSSATHAPNYRQKKRKLNTPIERLLCSGVSQRRAARLLGVNPKTVVRKFRLLGRRAREEHASWREQVFARKAPLSVLQFDDLETSEHSKCKPISVALAVEPKSRKILGFQVSRMPAKGPLSEIARKKYGRRRDDRPRGWNELFGDLRASGIIDEQARFLSDQNPHYPRVIRRHFPRARHETTPGARGCVVGQGELKRLVFDPLFSLNHTCAMLRANMNRLFRRTWCTTKTIQGLIDHLWIYVRFHNRLLTPRYTG
jgi:transposase-like protein